MGSSKKGATLGIHTRNEIIEEINARARALGLKKGTYGALILEWWAAQGFPAVTEPDHLMQIASQHRPKATKRAG